MENQCRVNKICINNVCEKCDVICNKETSIEECGTLCTGDVMNKSFMLLKFSCRFILLKPRSHMQDYMLRFSWQLTKTVHY